MKNMQKKKENACIESKESKACMGSKTDKEMHP